jgi:hypothetical protein
LIEAASSILTGAIITTGTECDPCLPTAVDVTSASSPAFAGLVTLLNDNLLNTGRKPLGFLNPLLYSMVEDDPTTFNDITAGKTTVNS